MIHTTQLVVMTTCGKAFLKVILFNGNAWPWLQKYTCEARYWCWMKRPGLRSSLKAYSQYTIWLSDRKILQEIDWLLPLLDSTDSLNVAILIATQLHTTVCSFSPLQDLSRFNLWFFIIKVYSYRVQQFSPLAPHQIDLFSHHFSIFLLAIQNGCTTRLWCSGKAVNLQLEDCSFGSCHVPKASFPLSTMVEF